MKLSDIAYKRPDLQASLALFEPLTDEIALADSSDKALEVLQAAAKLEKDLASQFSLCHIRHSIDTRDPFYKAEMDYADEATPALQEATQTFKRALLASPHRSEMERVVGKHAFDLIELSTRTISAEVLDDLVRENQLSSEYART